MKNIKNTIENYLQENNIKISDDAIWNFDKNIENELIYLINNGVKTATSSLHKFYEIENTNLPKVGDLNIITTTMGEYKTLIEITNVQILPFKKVDEKHAYKEGEGDKSLEYWRKVHEDFFKNELKKLGDTFDENDLIVLEEFKVLVGLENN